MKFKNIWNHIVNLKSPTEYMSNKNFKEVLQVLGNPQHEYKTIHVGGTNGKGSTSNFIYSYLKTKFKTGLFVSPCVLFEMELARVNDKFITEKNFVRIYEENEALIKKYKLTFFEVKTLIAFIWFKEQNVDYAVIEVGIGGEHDATNTLNPEACIITNIGDDHDQYLGDSFDEKAITKLGIQKPSTPLFTSEPRIKELSQYPENIILNKYEFNFNHFLKYQRHNYNIAIQLLVYLGFDKKEVSEVVKNTQLLPYRYQKIKNNIYFDASHNAHGIEALVKSLQDNKAYVFILSAQKQKNYLEMIKLLKTKGKVYLIDFNFYDSKLSFDAKAISLQTNTNYLEDISNLSIDSNKIYIFTGSFYFLNSILDKV